MSKPIRIQRKRTKGWKMPENTTYVGRPSKWGNPFKIDEDHSAEEVVKQYRVHILGKLHVGLLDISELKGKNLSCFCKIGQPCHADILLKICSDAK